MPAIPYVNNIPQGADLLSQSQPSLLTNTQGVSTFVNVDHLDFANGNAGMHKWVELPTPGAPAVVAGKIDLFPQLNNAGNFATGRNDLYVQPAAQVAGVLGTAIPATATSPVVNGWSYLPSGIIFQWGTYATPGGTSGVLAFPQPFPTVCLQVIVSTLFSNGDQNRTVQLNNFNAAGFTVISTQRTANANANAACTFLAIGY